MSTAGELLRLTAVEYPQYQKQAIDTVLHERSMKETYFDICWVLAWQAVEGYDEGKLAIRTGRSLMYFYADGYATLMRAWKNKLNPDPRELIKTHMDRSRWVEEIGHPNLEQGYFWPFGTWIEQQAGRANRLRGRIAVDCATQRFKARPLRLIQVLSRELAALERADRLYFPDVERPLDWSLKDVPSRLSKLRRA